MGNSLRGSKRTTKIMKIDGETTKHKTPIQAIEITKNHPGHVLLDSDSVKQHGIRAKPLDPGQYLEPKRLYFLVELPKSPDPMMHNRTPRRVRSGGIQMSAKERLESLMLSRRSVSDLSAFKPPEEAATAALRLKMRLPRAEVERLMSQSKDRAEAANRIMDLCVMGKSDPGRTEAEFGLSGHDRTLLPKPAVRRERSPIGGIGDGYKKKRVGFSPVTEDDIQLAVAS